MYLKWSCPKCKEVLISNSYRTHNMNICKCGKTGVDLETYGCRYMTDDFEGLKKTFKEYDYNFFDEIVLNMKAQGFEPFIKLDKLYIDLTTVYLIRELEDEIMESLK